MRGGRTRIPPYAGRQDRKGLQVPTWVWGGLVLARACETGGIWVTCPSRADFATLLVDILTLVWSYELE